MWAKNQTESLQSKGNTSYCKAKNCGNTMVLSGYKLWEKSRSVRLKTVVKISYCNSVVQIWYCKAGQCGKISYSKANKCRKNIVSKAKKFRTNLVL